MVTKHRQRLRDRNQPTGLLQARLADALDKIAVLSEENDQLKAELTDMRKVPNPARDIAAEANKLLAAKDAEIDRLTAVLEAVVAGDLNLSWTIRGYWYQSGKIHPYRYGPFDSISELAASISQAAERQKVTSERT